MVRVPLVVRRSLHVGTRKAVWWYIVWTVDKLMIFLIFRVNIGIGINTNMGIR